MEGTRPPAAHSPRLKAVDGHHTICFKDAMKLSPSLPPQVNNCNNS